MQIPRWLQAFWHRTVATVRASRMRCMSALSQPVSLFVLLALALAPSAQALEFRFTNPFPDGPMAGVARGLTLSGELEPGDTDRLIELIRRKPVDAWHGLGRVDLAISGGDEKEALRLADALAELYPYIVASSDCAGTCAIVWLSGAWRLLPDGRIGLQKPMRPPPDNAVQADKLRNYLFKQGVPRPSYERWLAAGNNSVYWLSGPEINSIGVWPPYYFEKLAARCPRLDASDESFHALRRCAARLVISQKAFAFDKLLVGVNDPWWNDNKDVFLGASR